jgi:signal transduction histidine kinase
MSLHPASKYWGAFSLRQLVENVCRPLQSRFDAQAIQMVVDIPADSFVTADRDLISRAVRTLVLNSIDAMPQGGLLFATSAAGPNAVELEIADTGESLSEDELHHVFDLVASAHRDGTGWGLAIVRQIIELHGGNVTVANCPDGGVAFTLVIPHTKALKAAA